MHLPLRHLVFVPACIAPVLADFLGPSYPAPRDLSRDESHVAAAWKEVASTLKTHLSNGSQCSSSPDAIPGIKNITFSFGMFSLHDPAATEMQFHYTSAEVANSPNGTHEVDGDSIYRIASITKVFTVLAALLELERTDWERPITEILPTLADYASKTPGGLTYTTHWDKITLNALAAQISGIQHDGFPNQGEIYLQYLTGLLTADPITLGFPPADLNDPLMSPPCLFLPECSPIAYTEGIENRAPVFLPWTTPAYSNNGFSLIGLAITNLTGKSMNQVYRERIFDPLGMSSSNSSTPPPSEWHRCVIPADPAIGFAVDSTVFVSSGGLLSTIRDLAKFGMGILNSTLLLPEETRKWLKPVSHTDHLQYSVGRPWEIMRYTHTSGVVTDIYTKLGDSGLYSSYLALLPDFDAGFTILAAGSSVDRFNIAAAIADVVTDLVLPALDAQARVEAERNFAGVYTSTIEGLNSSLVLAVNHTENAPPGLVISSWISNGTDVLDKLGRRLGTAPYRLVHSISDLENEQIAFRLINAADAPSVKAAAGLFSGPGMVSGDWLNVDTATFGGVAQNLFVFDVGPDWKATATSPAAFRVKLRKTA